MKRIISIIFILFLVGCSNQKYIKCDIEINNQKEEYEIIGIYKIYYDDNFVTQIEKKEKNITNNEDMIDYFKESKNLEYYKLNDLYSGFDYTINSSYNYIDLSAVIILSEVNIKNMVKDGYIDKDYTISNKLTTSGIVKYYESKGAICNI